MIMACHQATEDSDLACIGYLAVEGWSNLHVRLRILQGLIPMSDIEASCADLDLHPSFASMRDWLVEGTTIQKEPT